MNSAALLAAMLVLATPAAAGADEVLAKARALVRANRAYEAHQLMWKALDRYPADARVHEAYQLLAHNRGQYENTVGVYAGRYERAPSAESARLYARIDFDRPRAQALVRKAVESWPAHPGLRALAALHEAERLMGRGKHEDALKILDACRECLKLEPAATELARANLYIRVGRFTDAVAASSRAARVEPWEPASGLLAAQALFIAGDSIEAQHPLVPVYRLGEFAGLDAARAALSLVHGSSESAQAAYRDALTRPRDMTGWRDARIQAHDFLGDFDAAVQEAEAALAEDPEDRLAAVFLARAAGRRGEIAKAEAALAALHARDPRDLTVLGEYALLHIERERPGEALKLYDAAVGLAPGSVDLRLARAMTLWRLGDLKGADKDFKYAATKSAFYDRPDRAYAGFLRETGRHDECASYYQSLVNAEHRDIEVLAGLARCVAGLGDFERAAALYDLALASARVPADRDNLRRDRDWAHGEDERVTRLRPGDAPAKTVTLSEAKSLDAPDAAAGNAAVEVGDVWDEAPMREAFGWQHWPDRLLWSRDGMTLLGVSGRGVAAYSVADGASRPVRIEAPSAYLHSRASVWAAHGAYIIERVLGKDGEYVHLLLALDPKTGRTREIRRRAKAAGQLWADPARQRLLVFGSGNEEIDLKSGRVEPHEPLGCRLEVAVAPDGSSVACSSALAGEGAAELVGYDLAAKRRSFLGVTGERPSYSPDGKRLAFVWRERELRVLEGGRLTAYRMPGARDPLRTPDEAAAPTRWSPDGRFVFFSVAAFQGRGAGNDSRHGVVVEPAARRFAFVPGTTRVWEWRPGPVK